MTISIPKPAVLLCAALAAGLGCPAAAEEVAVDRPIAAGSLHEGPLDMVVYYVPLEGDQMEVTATFAPKAGGEASRIIMAMDDGDRVRFGVPGHRGTLYTFARTGPCLTVSVETVPAASPVAGAEKTRG